MMRRLLLALPLILLAWPALAACNPATSSCVGYVDVKSPAYGATGNGSADDTAHIQAAIDACFANSSCSGVYCPAGTYLTSSTLWLDPPNGERATTWTGTGYFTAGVLTISSTISGVGVITGTIDNGTGTGTPTGTVLTVTTDTSVVIASGSILTGAGIPAGETIVNQLSGPGGGIGGTSTWTVSISAAVTSTSITVSKIGVSSTVFATGANIQTALTGATGPTVIVSGSGPYTANNTLTLGTSGSPVSLSANAPAASTQFSFTMAFFGDPVGGGQAHVNGCLLEPTFNNNIAFLVGTGQAMRVSDIAVIAPSNAYRGMLDPNGVGIGIGSNGGGAATTLIQNTYVRNFYALYKTDAIGTGALSEGNRFHGVGGDNGYFGIFLAGTQAYNDQITEPRFGGVQIAIDSEFSKQVNVLGGNLSATTGVSNTFAISGTSAFGQYAGCPSWCVTTTLASPDQYVGTPVYNSYTIVTPYFGVIPMQMVNWNSSTNVATLALYLPWVKANYGNSTCWWCGGGGGADQVAAATTLYAAERDVVAQGMGIDLYGTHIENPNTCTTLFIATDVWGGQISNEVVDPYFNYDPASLNGASSAQEYCQQSFPFISIVDGGATLRLRGGPNNQPATNPLIIESPGDSNIKGSQLGAAWFNLRTTTGASYGQILPSNQFATAARGFGRWDNDYFLPAAATSGSALRTLMTSSDMTAEYCGYEPCPSATPNLSTTLFGEVSGGGAVTGTIDNGSGTGTPTGQILTVTADTNTVLGPSNVLTGTSVPAGETIINQITGPTGGIGGTSTWNVSITGAVTSTSITAAMGALGTYPPINCRTVYKSVDWNTPAVTAPSTAGGGIFKRSASCPGFSYGQNLVDATVGETVTWSYMANSDDLYLDAKTLSWMFPGLGISINSGGGAQPYIVTGVYPLFGYVTVIWAGSSAGGQLQGNYGQVYSCTSGCTIAEAPFAWTAY